MKALNLLILLDFPTWGGARAEIGVSENLTLTSFGLIYQP
jgi:hypothetical protein